MNKLILPTLALAATIFAASCSNNDSSKEETKKENSVEQTTTTKPQETQTMKPIEINQADFLLKVANHQVNTEWKYLGSKPAIVDFYAHWCGPCKAIAPILDELAAEYGEEIIIYKVDVDKEGDLANAYNIRSIPHMLFIPMEGEPQIINGARPKDEFKKLIDTVLLKK